jgi:hypothetical protein
MKTSMIILFVLITMSLVFSLITLLILVENHFVINFGNPLFPTSTPNPTPKSLLSYNQTSTEDLPNNYTRIVLSFNLTLIQGNSYSLNYSQFIVSPYVPRGGVIPNLSMEYLEAFPQEKGTVTVNDNDKTQVFQLTFYFATYGANFNGYVGHYTGYDVKYSGDNVLFSGQTNQTQI